MKPIIALLLVILVGVSHQTMNLTLLSTQDYPGAQCLDGSQAGVYYQKGWGSGEDKYIIYFEGGGACLAPTRELILISCYERSKTRLGSSKNWGDTRQGQGILSEDEKINSQFYNWNKFYVPYCDGACFQGYIAEPQNVLGGQIYFRGYNITISVFDYIFKTTNISASTQTILSGVSAGGMGTFFWGNYLGGLLPQGSNYFIMPDSGYFINYPEGSFFVQSIQQFASMSEPSLLMPAGCSFLNKTDELYKCVMPQYFINRIIYPVFIIESEYDEWQLQNSQLATCEKGLSLADCDQQQLTKINNFRNALTNIIQTSVSQPKARYQNWGAWAPACVKHGFTDRDGIFNDTNYQVAENSGNTLQQSIGQWIQAQISKNTSSTIIHIDQVLWPNNKPCSGVKTDSKFLDY